MSPIEQAFEIAYLRDRDLNSPITKDALLRGADGQYFHQHMRTYFQFFCFGYSAGATDAREAEAQPETDPCAGGHIPIGWTGTVHCEVCNKKLGDEPRIEPGRDEAAPAPAAEPKAIDPDCWGCFGMGDPEDKTNACQFCHTDFPF